MATKLDKKSEAVQVAMLLTVIGEEALCHLDVHRLGWRRWIHQDRPSADEIPPLLSAMEECVIWEVSF